MVSLLFFSLELTCFKSGAQTHKNQISREINNSVNYCLAYCTKSTELIELIDGIKSATLPTGIVSKDIESVHKSSYSIRVWLNITQPPQFINVIM